MTRENTLPLALDAMGGDNAPQSVVDGADIALTKFPDLRFLFFGDEAQLTPLLKKAKRLHGHYELVHTTDVVRSEDRPSAALRQGKNSSMRLAIDAVAQGKASGVVSAGNTGAFMAMSKLVFKTLPGIDRPAIAGEMPTHKHDILMLDLGANVACDADVLYQFAVIGDAFARQVLGLRKPTIGLLNIGSEDMKGHEEIQQAAQKLKENTLGLNYIGYVEGTDILQGKADVVVADGFTGNVALKTVEGTARFFASQMKATMRSSFWGRAAYVLARPAFAKLKKRLDARRYNGAMFLGLNGVAVKSHGGADGYAFYHAIREAHDMITCGVNERIIKEMATLANQQNQEEDRSAGTLEAVL